MYDFAAYMMMLGAVGGSGELPFWAQANRCGLMPESNGVLAAASARTSFDPSHKVFQWQWGAGLAANASSQGLTYFVDEAYLDARLFGYLRLDLGMKHREPEFLANDPSLGSVSSSGGHIIDSGNSRAMPGFAFRLEPWAVPFTGGRLKISGLWGDYKTLDEGLYVPGQLVHRLQAYVSYDFSPRFYARIGLDHYGLWGGTHPEYGAMPVTWTDYLRVALGRSGGISGSQIDYTNVIGDQGGAEQIRIGWHLDCGELTLQLDKPYSDKSGMRLANFPDGQYTLCWQGRDRDAWVSDVALEYIYTMWQSGAKHLEEYRTEQDGTLVKIDNDIKDIIGVDDYFNNYEYRSGWTYYGRTICNPLFYAGTLYWNGVTAIDNNRMKTLHLGLSGKLFRKAPYRLMVTCGLNYGTYKKPYDDSGSSYQSDWKWWRKNTLDVPLRQLSIGFDAYTPAWRGLRGFAGLYCDCGEVLKSGFGMTLGLRYSL